jgi:hypothetical protein
MPQRDLNAKSNTALLVAKDALSNLAEFIDSRTHMALLAIRDCERELDLLEAEVDNHFLKHWSGSPKQGPENTWLLCALPRNSSA